MTELWANKQNNHGGGGENCPRAPPPNGTAPDHSNITQALSAYYQTLSSII